ncbi:phosphotransferase family protein [Microbacterium sp. GXF7504]
MSEIVATSAVAAQLPQPPLLVLEPLRAYLRDVGFAVPTLQATRIGDGHSNVTFLLDLGDRRVVLRRGPRPPFPPSTHDMVREARILRALGEAGVPVPSVLDVCEDEAVLGVPFYLMAHLDGLVVTDAMPALLDAPTDRERLAYAAVDALAALHAVDVTRPAIAGIGRPDGYLRRQVDRFAGLWPAVSRRAIPAVDTMAAWLADHLPDSARASVVHGDYRIGNLMYAPSAPASVLAVLDWEMATLGDPLADLGYFVATYAEPGARATPLELTPVTRLPGFPTRDELVARYVERTGADVSALDWYRALALFKAAVFCEAIHTRWLDGETPGDAFGASLAQGVPALLREAADAAGIAVDLRPAVLP